MSDAAIIQRVFVRRRWTRKTAPMLPGLPISRDRLAFWYDASDASTITLNGSNVAQWDDKSGNNRHLLQATASRQPVYNSSLSAITVAAGLHHYLHHVEPYALTNVFVVAEWDGQDGSFPNFSGLVNGLNDNEIIALGNNGSANWINGSLNMDGQLANIYTNGSDVHSSVAFPAIQTRFLLRVESRGAAAQMGGFNVLSERGMYAASYPQRTWIGKLHEVVALSSNTAAEVERVEQHLLDKWGIGA